MKYTIEKGTSPNSLDYVYYVIGYDRILCTCDTLGEAELAIKQYIKEDNLT